MSKFFKALEQAEHERALRKPAAPPTPEPTHAPVAAPPAAPAPAPAQAAAPVQVAAPTAAPVIETARPTPEATPVREPSPFARPPQDVVHRHEAPEGELDDHLVSLLAPSSFGAEQYRVLRHMVEQLHRASDLSIIAVTSPDASDGKTTTAINLAGALAQAPDARVLLIDADLRAANVASRLGLDEYGRPGLVDAITNPNLRFDAVLQAHTHLNLSVLPAGRRPSAPYEVLKSPRVAELIAEARRRFDYVIVDTAPLVSVPDSRVIGKWVDGFLMVVAAHRTPRKLLEEALNLLEPAKIVGMVFNGDDRHLSRSMYPSKRRRVLSGISRNRQAASDD